MCGTESAAADPEKEKAAELAFGGLLRIGAQEGGGLAPIDFATALGEGRGPRRQV